MHSFIHIYRTAFQRFRWDIIGFWLLSCSFIIAYAGGVIHENPPLEYRLPRWNAFDRLEFIAIGWIILRLMVSDPILLTHGGWRTRPVPRGVIWCAPFALLATALLPAVLLRILVIHSHAMPDMTQWPGILTRGLLPGAAWITLAACVVRTGAPLVSRRSAGRKIKIVFALLCLIVTVAWLHPATAYRVRRTLFPDPPYRSGGGQMNYSNRVPGIQERLPEGGTYVGDWAPMSPPAKRVREVVRFPIKQALVLQRDGIRVETKHIRPEGRRLNLAFDLTVADPALTRDLWDGVMVLRYAGDMYAFRRQTSDWQEPAPFLAMPLTKLHCISYFDSPMGYLWNDKNWDELLADAELMIFVPDKSLPPIEVLHKIEAPKLERQIPPGVAGSVTTTFDVLDTDYWESEKMRPAIDSMPASALPHILARHPWSDNAWERFVKPFLLKHAQASDKAALLERFATEPRLGEILVTKGWQSDAIPLLRKFAKDRLPLDAESLAALARERDPALATDLAALAARLPNGVEKLEPLLREHPGFDWNAFVQEGWLRRKYSFRQNLSLEPFRLWAARQGDFSAFRDIAADAACGEASETEEIKNLVSGVTTDLFDHLRKNIDLMKFDPQSQTWQ